MIKDFKKLEVISDWTFSTPYKGSVGFLSKHADRIKQFTSLEIPRNLAEEAKPHKITIQMTEENIPFERLG